MRIIGYKAIVPDNVIDIMKKTLSNPYADGGRFFNDAADMTGIAYEPIYEKANKNAATVEFFNPLSPTGSEKIDADQTIDFIF